MHRFFRFTSYEYLEISKNILKSQGFIFESLPFHPLAYKLIHEPFPLGNSILANFGYIYIQDKSSMLPPIVLNPKPQSVVLDMCASPGSKTGFLSKMVGVNGMVIANEPNQKRLQTLRANLRTINALNTVTCSYPGEQLPFEDNLFSHILLDVPCSGWGTIEKHKNITELWTLEKTKTLVGIQRLLLKKAAKLLAPGGFLVYSTCTTNKLENEDQINWARAELGLEVLKPELVLGFDFDKKTYAKTNCLLINHITSDSQGFFVALLTKNTEKTESTLLNLTIESMPKNIFNKYEIKENILDNYLLSNFGETIYAIPKLAQNIFTKNIKWRGFPIAKNNKFKIFPRNRVLLPNFEEHKGLNLDIDDVKKILSGQSFTLQNNKLAGLYTEKMPLGWITRKQFRYLWSE